MNIYNFITLNKQKEKKLFAVLIDPDKQSTNELVQVVEKAVAAKVDLIFVGGSLLTNGNFATCISTIKSNCSIPVVIFPGNSMQVNKDADGILFLSLISGRNPDMLIGNQVISAPLLKHSNLEILPTGYILIDSGKPTTVSYMSNTTPIPHDKNDVAMCTAMAGEMLGLKLIFMDGGSGATNPISESMINMVSQAIDAPLIIGGGICSGEKAIANCKAGADIVVVGNSIEKNPNLLEEIAQSIQHYNTMKNNEMLSRN
ncbi:MAG TPA: geranylgeranylglyceryl/heptaprenylglyceryl phosphate synthase [Flavobacteriales bacterium]|nr:geranylgeranylglyceryl/heptaprenylglyceryl phosphate synthase [Flavobacteriales bacterium]|tara:strand:- start:909 stop:1682 length:774 start_codon:yes stop_codon:yes gene_type:complete